MTLNYKNSSIHYTDFGQGEPVILLHGFLENSTMWTPVIGDLPKHFRFICIDLPGHGKTDNLGYIHTMEDMADLVEHVLNVVKIKDAYIIGHSMGGYVALALAEKKPQLFKGICLMNSTYEADDEERQALRTRANKMIKNNFESMVRMSFANLFAPNSKIKFKSEFDTALSEALNTSLQGYIAAQEGMKIRENRLDVFLRLNAKKIIILGLKDPVINVDLIKEEMKGSDVDLAELSEGHMSYIENKSELSYFLKHFIE